MNILNSYFEKIFIISSNTSYERLEFLFPTLRDLELDFELIIAPNKQYFSEMSTTEDNLWVGGANKSLVSANESILLSSIINKYQSICVLEDDICFENNWEEKLTLFMDNVPDMWDILNLGYHEDSNVNMYDISHKILENDIIVGTHVVAYTNNIYELVLTTLNDIDLPIDWILSKFVYTNVNTYIPSDTIFTQLSYRSVSKSIKTYKSTICF